MPTPNKQIIIDAIIKEIEKGTTRGNVISKFVKKCRVTERTIDRYWKTANQQHAARQQAIKDELAEIDKQAAIDARKKQIMSSNDRKEYLSSIILAKTDVKTVGKTALPILVREDGTKEIIYLSDKLKALAELNKMDGDYASNKIEHSGEIAIKQITGMVIK